MATAVNSKATTAIQHFINFGESEGRNPSPFYNNSYYLGKNLDVAAAVDRDEITGIGHFIQFGESENRSPSPLYNDSYYLAKNPDITAAVERDELTGINTLSILVLLKGEMSPHLLSLVIQPCQMALLLEIPPKLQRFC